VGSVDVQILRGVIDLVFREPDGWVIVDYKTDRSAIHDQDRLKEVYKPQLTQYARAWAQLTGEPVKEVGLLFTETQSYVTL
jgi:ATP-dependent helicase/nuclease subunit A